MEGLNTEVSHSVAAISTATGVPTALSGRAKAIPFTHIKTSPEGTNPVLSPGIEYCLVDKAIPFSALRPWFFEAVPEIPRDGVFATRDLKNKSSCSPGENVVAKATPTSEAYATKVKGRLVLIGDAFHVIPSDIDAKVIITVSEDNLGAEAALSPGYGSGRKLEYSYAKEEVDKAGIVFGLDPDRLKDAIALCNADLEPVGNVPVAIGLAPKEGICGTVDYFYNTATTHDFEAEVEATQQVDFRSLNLIPVVEKGQLLVRIHSEKAAVAGKGINGQILPAPRDPPKPLIPGNNVRGEKDGNELFSEINGCVNVNGVRLEVLDTFVVNSDVDYRTGNIKFAGSILVNGMVHQGFEIEAEGDVIVLKNVEPSKIKAGRDIIVKGGILGDGKGQYSAVANRNVTVGFTENAWIEAQGDVAIGDYAMRSFIYACGQIKAEGKKGAIIGGECMAAKGLVVKILGSLTGIKTMAAAGIDFIVVGKLAAVEKQTTVLRESLNKIDRVLKATLVQAQTTALTAAKTEAVKNLMEKRAEINQTLITFQEQIKDLVRIQLLTDPVEIRYTGKIFPEVILNIRGQFLKITTEASRAVFLIDPATLHIVSRGVPLT